MGICLDTAAPVTVTAAGQQLHELGLLGKSPAAAAAAVTRQTLITARGVMRPPAPPYQPPGAVIYVLGGPGTGKVTLSEALVRRAAARCGSGAAAALAHVHLTRAIADYARHFGLASASKVAAGDAVDLLVASIRAAAPRTAFLVSGFPRNVEDLVECAKKVSRLDGMILLDHSENVLRKLIADGVQSGALTAEEGEQELSDFTNHVIPFVDLMKNKGILHKVSASECDFDELVAELERIVRKVASEANSRQPASDKIQNKASDDAFLDVELSEGRKLASSGELLRPSPARRVIPQPPLRKPGARPVIFVIGGPGSSKTASCDAAAALWSGWCHLSCSRLLRQLLSDQLLSGSPELAAVRQILSAGELAPTGLVLSCLARAKQQNPDAKGFIVSGFPADLDQLEQFELEHGRGSDVILLDCSELELGRTLGRRQDVDTSVKALRRRLQVYRTVTLPALKQLEQQRRLLVVDGDGEQELVQEELRRLIYMEQQRLAGPAPASAASRASSPGSDEGSGVQTINVDSQVAVRISEVEKLGRRATDSGHESFPTSARSQPDNGANDAELCRSKTSDSECEGQCASHRTTRNGRLVGLGRRDSSESSTAALAEVEKSISARPVR